MQENLAEVVEVCIVWKRLWEFEVWIIHMYMILLKEREKTVTAPPHGSLSLSSPGCWKHAC
jgi:hypothetical protein